MIHDRKRNEFQGKNRKLANCLYLKHKALNFVSRRLKSAIVRDKDREKVLIKDYEIH